MVAAARNRVIGLDGAMPWHLPSDLKRYRQLTMGRPMIMGRKTLEAIGRVLDGRDTIVLTRAASLPFDGAILAGSVEEALQLAAEAAKARGSNEIVIAGGAEIYRQFLAVTDRIAMTVVEAEPLGDTLFPEIAGSGFSCVSSAPVPKGPSDSADCRFEMWERHGG
ncbi:dihydrofolate reductase [Aureimonas sp. AU12]|uniref:dihydrofolate reductase n=1 Tax=Aureimonas sp. AU12 TaxID=1638161 RepID=UPI001FCDAB8E|nr:dihydrofolate reductase [Aureimonas sp. AU12]